MVAAPRSTAAPAYRDACHGLIARLGRKAPKRHGVLKGFVRADMRDALLRLRSHPAGPRVPPDGRQPVGCGKAARPGRAGSVPAPMPHWAGGAMLTVSPRTEEARRQQHPTAFGHQGGRSDGASHGGVHLRPIHAVRRSGPEERPHRDRRLRSSRRRGPSSRSTLPCSPTWRGGRRRRRQPPCGDRSRLVRGRGHAPDLRRARHARDGLSRPRSASARSAATIFDHLEALRRGPDRHHLTGVRGIGRVGRSAHPASARFAPRGATQRPWLAAPRDPDRLVPPPAPEAAGALAPLRSASA